MSKYRDFIEGQDEPKVEPAEGYVYGAYTCQECAEVVIKARYLKTENKLTWECPEGHVTTISFRL